MKTTVKINNSTELLEIVEKRKRVHINYHNEHGDWTNNYPLSEATFFKNMNPQILKEWAIK